MLWTISACCFQMQVYIKMKALNCDLTHAGLQVTSLPSVLFESNGGLHNVVEGSVIQLYCSVESTTVSFSWTKDGNPVVIDVPHLRERTTYDSTTTTSVLTVDNFQSSDTGTYQCSARDGMRTGNGETVILNSTKNNDTCITMQLPVPILQL